MTNIERNAFDALIARVEALELRVAQLESMPYRGVWFVPMKPPVYEPPSKWEMPTVWC